MNIIEEHFNDINLDLKKSKNGRWIDQKCTPDVTCAVAETILEFCRTNNIHYFTQTDIRESYFASFIVSEVFNKPAIEEAPNEYDKFFSQPIKMLANAQILNEDNSCRPFTYTIQEFDILLRISQRDRYAKEFIFDYITKVLTDSNIFHDFNRFLDNPNTDNFHLLKDNYCEFIISNTPINGKVEVSRIFTKVLNPLAENKNTFGTIRGHISNRNIVNDDLMYNRLNWRDEVDKHKYLSRDDWKIFISKQKNYNTTAHNRDIKKAVDTVKRLHSTSEVSGKENATQHHHIFPKYDFPQIASYEENIIKLTPNEHFSDAHPDNATRKINKEFQTKCLLAKLESIESYLNEYSLINFVEILNVGYRTNYFTIGNISEIRQQILNFNNVEEKV